MGVWVLMGPPGVGKGTVAKLICERAGFRHVSTGDLLREAIRAGTPLGREAERVVGRGELVSDDLMMGLLEEEWRRPGDILLDGFPRTPGQAEQLERRLGYGLMGLRGVVGLEAPEAVIRTRLEGRRICRVCGAIFHVQFRPSRVEGVCDRCGGVLEQRADDRPEAVQRRLEVFREQQKVLEPYYRERGIYHAVEATGAPEAIAGRVLAVMGVSSWV